MLFTRKIEKNFLGFGYHTTKKCVLAGLSLSMLLGSSFSRAAEKTHYSLPPAAEVKPAPGTDMAFLKAFSKVFSNLAKETRPSLVLIVAQKKVTISQPDFPDDFFFPFLPPQFGNPNGRGQNDKKSIETDAGSGFIVDLKNGYVITNNHVIDGADTITVTTYDNRKYKAKLLGTAKNLDIAVLKLEDFKPTPELKQVSLGDSSKAEVGDWVLALGAPFELPQTLTMGVISALQRTSDVLGIGGANSFIQTDAAINPGNSGGPLVNLDGQVIGMNTAIYSKNGTSVGIGFAIPANTIRLVADSIINTGRLVQAFLGVEMYPLDKFSPSALKEMKIAAGTEGALVMKVVPESPAAKAGLQPYDVIRSVQGTKIKSPSDIQRQIMFLKPGTKVTLGVLRSGKPIEVTAMVTEFQNEKAQQQPGHSQEQKKDSLATAYGMTLSSEKGKRGVIISSVRQGSAADLAGLQKGDSILAVNSRKVTSPKDVETILQEMKNKKDDSSAMLFLLVERGGVESAVILQVAE